MSALPVVLALIRNLRVLDDEMFMEDEPEELRSLVRLGDDRLLDLLRDEAEAEDEYPDDDELAPLVAERRLAFWSEMLTDDEALESAVYAVEVGLPGIVDEMVGYCEMVVTRQPALAGAVAKAQGRFLRELEGMFR